MSSQNIKSTVLSDIDHEDSGIIPYALKLAKDLKSEVNVIHVIDTRTNQGIYTPYSDSKSVTPGVESYEEILEKEKEVSEGYLAKHVGREVSVLNYPLKVNYDVLLGHLDEIISERTENNENDLLIMSARPEGKVWENYEEVFDIISGSGSPVLLIPPDIEYHKPQNVAFIDHMESEHSQHIKEMLAIFNEIPVHLQAVNISGENNYQEKLKSDPGWQGITGKIDQYHTLSKPATDDLLEFTEKQSADLLVLFEKKRNLLKRMTSKSLAEKLAEKSEKPLLVFYK